MFLTLSPLHQSYIKKRLFMFRFGDRRTQMNWVHVRNLVQAHVLAAEALTAAKGHVAVSLLQCSPSLPPRLQVGAPHPYGIPASHTTDLPNSSCLMGLSAQESWGVADTF